MIWIKSMVKRGKVEALRNEGKQEQIRIRNKAVFIDAACDRAPLKNAAGKAPLTQTVR